MGAAATDHALAGLWFASSLRLFQKLPAKRGKAGGDCLGARSPPAAEAQKLPAKRGKAGAVSLEAGRGKRRGIVQGAGRTTTHKPSETGRAWAVQARSPETVLHRFETTGGHAGTAGGCGDGAVFQSLRRWLDRYFAGENPAFTWPLAPEGSDFQKAVWQEIRRIPYGAVVTYGAVARQLGTGCARAVGQAAGRNPIALIIPCHRVIGANGALTGYAGGLEKKLFLLNLEQPPAVS
jgi:methylated-DNA-[protein]-cysteine S-methyltransferase